DVIEGVAECETDRPARMAAADRVLVDPVAERGVLPRPADDVRQRDAANQAVALVGGEDGEGEGAAGGPRALVELELEPLARDGVEALVARRVPRLRVIAVGAAQAQLLVAVVERGRADRGRAVLEPQPCGHAAHPPRA